MKYQKEQTAIKLKKAYSALAQTTQRAVADYGPIKTWEIGTTRTGETARDFANKYIIPYLQISRNCELNLDGSCKFEYKSKNSANKSFFGTSRTRFYLNDGTLVGVLAEVPEDFVVYFDINGQKGPNEFGRDIFEFWYYIDYPQQAAYNGKFLPGYNHFTREDHLDANKQGSCKKQGWSCADLIMKDSWQIKDDYPW